MSNPIFKTIEACELRLVAGTVMDAKQFGAGNMDTFAAKAARVSFGNEGTNHTVEEDTKLIRYLAKHDHLTPFEYQHATFMIECPLFIRSQIHRHRTFSFNEISRRYTSDDLGFWIPTTWRKQATVNKQASDGNLNEANLQHGLTREYQRRCEQLKRDYDYLIESGVAREQARAILPQSLLTRFYMGGNLRNWAHFLKLRMDSHAQPEVQCIASRIYQMLYDMWPTGIKALMRKD